MYDSSSDSEDDCYNNVASKLHKLKDKYQDDKLDSTKLLDDSYGELDRIVSSLKPTEAAAVEVTATAAAAPETSEAVIEIENINESSKCLDDIIKNHNSSVRSSSKRVTRASARKSAKNNVENTPSQVSANTPSQVSVPSPVPTTNSVVNGAASTRTTSGRARGRGRRSIGNIQASRGNRSRRNRTVNNRHYNAFGPIYSVGNTDEYPDMSDDVQLFSNNTKPIDNDVVFVDVTESLEDNEEMSVKVYWQNNEFVKFMIRKFQKISQIFDYFAKRENVNHNNLLFTYKDKILKPDDTPESIGYRIAKFIDGGIVHQNVTKLTSKGNESSKNGIKIKFQCQNVKKPFETYIGLDEKFSLAMMKYSENIEKPLDKLKFEFDGDSISGKSTPRELDLEGGECIDVKILS